MNDNKNMKMSVALVSNSVFQPQSPIEKIDKARGYMTWGEKNTYPTYLYDLYLSCSTHQSIIDGTSEYVYGNGLIINPAVPSIVDDKGTKIESLIKKIISDYILFGGFNVQVIQSKGGTKTQYIWMDSQWVRYDEELTKGFYSKTWGKFNSKALEYSLWDGKAKDSIYAFRGSKTRGVYPISTYAAAITSIETDSEIQNYHLNAIKNNFNASAIINFNDGIPDDEAITQIQKGIEDQFCGTNNTNKFMITFNKSKENAVEIVRLESDKADEKFQTLSKDTKQNIYAAHRVTSPGLFGIVMDTPLSSQEYTEAFEIYNGTVISSIQKTLEEQFDIMFGVEGSIRFNEFKLKKDNKPNQEIL